MYFCCRKACKTPLTDNNTYYNKSTKDLYCKKCAYKLNELHREEASKLYGTELCVKTELPKP